MTAATDVTAPGAPGGAADRPAGVARTNTVRTLGLVVLSGFLCLFVVASIAWGSTSIPFSTVLDALFAYSGSNEHIIVRELRLPRTLLGVLVGAALGAAGALMQALTRNPLADPGILGVNAGAGFFVVMSIWVLGLSVGDPTQYLAFSFVGAALAALVVYGLGSLGRGGATPVRLALAGVAVGAVLGGITRGVTLMRPRIFDQFRHWSAGSLVARQMDVIAQVAPFIVTGLVVSLCLGRALNTLALGEDTARALGAHVGWTRAGGVVAITLLCGAATAAAGPIGFVGLVIPHFARRCCGPDNRWVLPYSMVLGAMLVLCADIVGRVIVRPAELQVGLVTAVVGAPVLIVLARHSRLTKL